MNLKDFFEFGRLDFALNGQTHTHTHTHTKEEDPYGKMGDTSENPEDTSMGQNEPF